jgi:hypothetical protein
MKIKNILKICSGIFEKTNPEDKPSKSSIFEVFKGG